MTSDTEKIIARAQVAMTHFEDYDIASQFVTKEFLWLAESVIAMAKALELYAEPLSSANQIWQSQTACETLSKVASEEK